MHLEGMDQAQTFSETYRSGAGFARRAADIQTSRWTNNLARSRHPIETPADQHLISLSLMNAQVRWIDDERILLQGTMAPGALHITGPGRSRILELTSPGDFIFFHVADDHLRQRQEVVLGHESSQCCDLDGYCVRDPVAEQLGRALADGAAETDPTYADAVAQTLLTRLLNRSQTHAKVNALAKWRLMRVLKLVDTQIAEPIRLADLAAAAGLSRMHFAAQFRVATGYTPHEYLTWRRIESAKSLLTTQSLPLVEVALSVGFLNQAHFTTVFKKVTGETPARWRGARSNQAGGASSEITATRIDVGSLDTGRLGPLLRPGDASVAFVIGGGETPPVQSRSVTPQHRVPTGCFSGRVDSPCRPPALGW